MNDWISVKNRLPDWYTWVLGYATFYKLPLGIRRVETGKSKDDWQWDFSHYVGLHDCTITHWMPIPEPPEVNDE